MYSYYHLFLYPRSQLDIKISGYILMGVHPFYDNDINTKYNSTDIYWSLENRQIEKMQEYLNEKGVKQDSSDEIIVQYVYKYIIEDTIEKRIEQILREKQLLFDELVDRVSILL